MTEPPAAAQFLGKKATLIHLITFRTCSKQCERTRFLTFKSQLKKYIAQSSFYLQFKFKTCLKSCILVLNFVSDLAQAGGSN